VRHRVLRPLIEADPGDTREAQAEGGRKLHGLDQADVALHLCYAIPSISVLGRMCRVYTQSLGSWAGTSTGRPIKSGDTDDTTVHAHSITGASGSAAHRQDQRLHGVTDVHVWFVFRPACDLHTATPAEG